MRGLIDSLWLYTMNRCNTMQVPPRVPMRARLAITSLVLASLAPALPFCLLFAAPQGAHAQETVRREAPKDVVLGLMTVVLPPVIQMNGVDDRLSPGSRIHDTRNMLVLSASLAGQTVPVVYKRDPSGLVHEVWILSPNEYSQLSGISSQASDGLIQFVNLLALIFGARL